MRFFSTFIRPSFCLLLMLKCIFFQGTLRAQQTAIREYVLFSGNGSCPGGHDQKQPKSPGYAVQLGAASFVEGGNIGSYRLIKTTGRVNIQANIFSGGTVTLANANSVTGKITAANSTGSTGYIFSAGTAAAIGGNIDVNGNIYIAGGTVGGTVTHPLGSNYSGPMPGGGDVKGQPLLPGLPPMPPITNFPAYHHIPDITTSKTITPGAYGDIELPGNKTLTFSGTGVYVFNKIDNKGNANHFIFDFKNNPSGTIKIYVHEDADLGKIVVRAINGGDATRIFTEVHGNGSSCSNKTWGFNIANGYSANSCTKWLGTVWVPYAAINIGSGSGNSNITGALWSGTQVNIQCGAKIIYAPFNECTSPNANAGPDKSLDFDNQTTLTGTSLTAGVTYSWKAINGGVITSAANTAAITVSSAGGYILTVTSATNCSTNDTAIVTGKTNNLIGSELQSIFQNFSSDDPPSPFFTIQHDSIFIDIITKEGRYAEALGLLTTPAYGLTNILSNGNSTFIITGLFPISKLPLLNALTDLIVYARPYYKAYSNAGLVTSAGDTSVRANLVRDGYKLQGQGIKVGVISDSYNSITSATTTVPITNTAAQDVGNGDLPGVGNPNGDLVPVNVLRDYPLRSADEGRAMLQIVHDIAPKAELYFRTGFISGGDFAAGITDLQQAGCNVIVDDVTFITEPFLKDGVVANAVDAAVAAGTTYFSAAGNFANKSYENVFSPVAAPGGLPGTAHNFGGNDVFQNVTLSPGNYTIVLQWLDDIYSLGQTATGGTKNDLDIYLTPNTDGTALFGFNRNNTNGDPIEILPFTITSTVNTNILITNNTIGSTPARFKYVVFRGDITFNEYNTGTSTIVGQANAAGAIAVGAASYDKVAPFPGPLTVESYSSTGGTVINNVQRNKPELVGPDGVNTTVNLGGDYDHDGKFSNFFGTSAAAPHAAAVAALIMEGRNKFLNQPITTPAEIRAILQNSATSINGAGFNFTSGYGFINADSAMRTFAQPDPSIVKLVYPTSVVPGQAPFSLTVTGINLSANSVITFRGTPLPTTVVNSGEATAVIPAFTGNPAISVYTPPISPSNLDGGYSDTLYFFNIAKQHIIVTANDTSKRYGEVLPEFTATILVDSVPLSNTSLKLVDIGLDSISYTTLGGISSDVGTYLLTPSRAFDTLNSFDRGLQELYTYTFNPGSFTINKLPVSIIPQEATVTFGQKIPAIQFTYSFDGKNIPDSATFLSNIQSSHQSQLAKDNEGNDVLGLVNGRAVTIFNGRAVTIFNGQAVTISNGRAVTIFNGQEVPVVNPQALTIENGIVTDTSGIKLSAEQLKDLSFLTTVPSLQNARQITNQLFVNGQPDQKTTNVVDITQQSILDYNVNAAQTNMLRSVSYTNAKGLVDVESFLNGEAVTILNGRAVTIFNGRAVTIFNGRAVTIFNGRAVTIFNGDTIPIVASQNKTAVIVDSSEIGVEPQSELKSLNVVTGFDAGNQFILPGSLMNNNLEVTYGLGKLTILPAPLTIKANDAIKTYGETLNLDSVGFTISSGALMYGDSLQHVMLSSAGAASGGTGGIHPIVASSAMGSPGTDLSNYAITYLNGNLTVLKAHIIVKATDACKVYGDPNPPFTATYTGFINGQSVSTSGITGSPGFSTAASVNSCVGKYPVIVTQGSLSSPNYTFGFLNGTLTILKAGLNVKADDKIINKGDAIPVFTSRLNKLKAGDNPLVCYRLSPSCTGSAGVYNIIPLLKPFSNSKNYSISYTNGKLYINPKGSGAKKLNLYLDCVEETGTGVYIAHFYCINDNRTPVYVPEGTNNALSYAGSFENITQPVIFMPGVTKFNVPFDGSSLKWELKTYDGYVKTSTSASANTSSVRCKTNTAGRSANKSGPAVSGVSKNALVPAGDANVYPNPASNHAIVYIPNEVINGKMLSIFDSYGKSYPLRVVSQVSGNAVEIDLSGLAKGTYFIRAKLENSYKSVSVVKQ